MRYHLETESWVTLKTIRKITNINKKQKGAKNGSLWNTYSTLLFYGYQKQPSRDGLRKSCSEKMQQIYRGTPMRNCDFNKVDWNHPSAWVFACKFAAYFQNIFYKTTSGGLLLDYLCVSLTHTCILIKKWKFHWFLTGELIDTKFNVNSVRNKFDSLVFTQIDSSFLSGYFFTKDIKHIIDYTEMLIIAAFFCM